MAKAIWNGAVIAESDRCVRVGSQLYFPPESLHRACVSESDTHTTCGIKLGRANYYNIVVGGKVNPDAVWYYPSFGNPAYQYAEGYVAFWKGVEIVE